MTVHTRDAEVTNYEWCDQELANKKSDGIHLIITRRERCNTLLGLFLGGGEGFLTFPPHRTMSRDLKQHNAQTEHTHFQVRGVVSRAQAVAITSLVLPPQWEKPFVTAQNDTRVVRTSFGAGARAPFSALCQHHRSFFSPLRCALPPEGFVGADIEGFPPLGVWTSSVSAMAAQLR